MESIVYHAPHQLLMRVAVTRWTRVISPMIRQSHSFVSKLASSSELPNANETNIYNKSINILFTNIEGHMSQWKYNKDIFKQYELG
jgi:hypothetical protein